MLRNIKIQLLVTLMFAAVTHGALAGVPTKDLGSSGGAVQEANEVAVKEAEIARSIGNSDKPRRTYITPRTEIKEQADYYKKVEKIIEKKGAVNWPTEGGNKLYGKGIVAIPIAENGTLFEDGKGLRIEKSTGNPLLDDRVIEIIRQSSPFPQLPIPPSSSGSQEVWTLILPFDFSKSLGQGAQ